MILDKLTNISLDTGELCRRTRDIASEASLDMSPVISSKMLLNQDMLRGKQHCRGICEVHRDHWQDRSAGRRAEFELDRDGQR